MTTAKHTPGPWSLSGNPQNHETNPQFADWRQDVIGPVEPAKGNSSVVVATIINRDSPYGEANARLIAAAPELLSNLHYIDSVAPVDQPEDGEYFAITITGKALRDIRAAIRLDRLCPLVVRCGCCRFICGAQDLQTLINYVRAGGDYVRDVSVHPDTIRQAANHRHYAPAPDEGDYGGAFDGNQVTSDADPGL